VRIYRWLLRLLPREFQRRQQDELLAAAAEALATAQANGRSQTRVHLSLAADVVATAWSLRVGAFWRGVWQDLRFALRLLGRAPGFAIVAVLTLGLGIAATSTIFTLVNAFYFKPSEFPDPARLMSVSETSATQLCSGCSAGVSAPTLADWRARATSFESLEAYDETPLAMSGSVTPERLSGARVSGGLFAVLGIAPVAGRTFDASDDRPGAPAVALVSHRLWQRLFAGELSAIGRQIRVDGVPTLLVGVMPARFNFPERADVWVPLSSAPMSSDRSDRRYGVAARLRADVTIDRAQTEMTGIATALSREHPATGAEWTAAVRRFGADRVGSEGGAFLTMLAAVGLVLAIACANLAALFLARAAARYRELTLRAALGAGRGRLTRQLVIESLVIAALGGGGGLLLTHWGVGLVRIGGLAGAEVPYYIDFSVDWRVVLFAGVVSILTGLLVGLVPSLAATRLNLVDGLKQGGAALVGGERRHGLLRSGLVVTELAVLLVLLSGAALTVRTFLTFYQAPTGYDLRGLTLAQLPLSGPRFAGPGALRAGLADLARRFDAVPGGRVAISHTFFLRGFGADERQIRVEGVAALPAGASPGFGFSVTPQFFDVQGLKIVAGRAFTNADRAGADDVAMVNENMARAIWPGGQSAIGRRVQLRPWMAGEPWRTIVGVVSNMEGDRPAGGRRNPFAYVPLEQWQGRPIEVLVRTSGDVAPVLSALRAAIAQVDPDQPLTNIRSAQEEHQREYFYVGYFTAFYASFAVFGLLLGLVGVHGVVSQTISERMREFGIRAALGADRVRLTQLVLGRSVKLALAGAALGLAAARLATPLLGWLLYGANPGDPWLLGAAAIVLIATAAIASYFPARRAARVDPLIVLKSE
jgi:predicted permease